MFHAYSHAAKVCLLLMSGLAMTVQSVYAGQMLSLDSAVAEALDVNPSLAAMRVRAHALAEVPPQVGTLPDPRLSLNALNMPVDSFSFTEEGMTQLQVGISQALPFFGKRALREEAASLEAEAAVSAWEETRLQLIRDVKTAWWMLFYLDRALEIVNRNQHLLRQFVTVAQTKYKVGEGLQQDVLLAQLELSKLLDQSIALQGSRREGEAQLNALLNRPAENAIALPPQADETLPPVMAEAQLLKRSLEIRPQLEGQQSRVEAARARVDLARKDYAPDFMVGAAYGFRSGENPDGSERPDFASVMFSMNLPIRTHRRDRAVDQFNSELLQQQYLLDDSRRQVAVQISRDLAGYRRAREQAELFLKGIIPQARQTVASMMAGYQVNKVDFLNLVRAQVTLYDYEIRYWKTVSEANQALARLEAAVGGEAIYE